MKPLLILATGLMSACIASSASAAPWLRLGEFGESVTYVDPDSVQGAGQRWRIWVLVDRTKPLLLVGEGSVSWSSTRTLVEFDCKGQAARTRAAVYYAGPMGAGRALMSDYEVDEWKYVPPGSTLEPQWRYACASRRNVQPR
jgi:hypothetical protein